MIADEVEEAMDVTLSKQCEFWMGLMSSVAAKSATSIADLHKMDVFDFFALLSAIEKQSKK